MTMSLFSSIKTKIKASRPSNLMKLNNEIVKSGIFERRIDMYYLPDGITALYRSHDGNAYEVTIKPAENSDNFDTSKKDKK